MVATDLPDSIPQTMTFVYRDWIAWFAFVSSIIFVVAACFSFFTEPAWKAIVYFVFFASCLVVAFFAVRKGPSKVELTPKGFSIGKSGSDRQSYNWLEFDGVISSDVSGEQAVYLRYARGTSQEPYIEDGELIDQGFLEVWLLRKSSAETKRIFEVFLQRHQAEQKR